MAHRQTSRRIAKIAGKSLGSRSSSRRLKSLAGFVLGKLAHKKKRRGH